MDKNKALLLQVMNPIYNFAISIELQKINGPLGLQNKKYGLLSKYYSNPTLGISQNSFVGIVYMVLSLTNVDLNADLLRRNLRNIDVCINFLDIDLFEMNLRITLSWKTSTKKNN